jgi:Holliday junction resolvase RusA-like endonuclease
MKFTILIEPEAKQRPRVMMKGGHPLIYSPSENKKAEDAIRREATRQLDMQPIKKDVPLILKAVFYRRKPDSKSKKVLYPVSKPDIVNYLSLLCDALEAFAYENDSQIVDVIVGKRYGSPPRIEIEIEEKFNEGRAKEIEQTVINLNA